MGPTASYPKHAGGSFLRGQAARGMRLTTHLHLVPRLRMVELHVHSPIFLHGIVLNWSSTLPSHCVEGDLYCLQSSVLWSFHLAHFLRSVADILFWLFPSRMWRHEMWIQEDSHSEHREASNINFNFHSFLFQRIVHHAANPYKSTGIFIS
jgi:hypothetical protein